MSHASVSSHFSLASAGDSPDLTQRVGIEMLCNDVVLPSTATLHGIRQYCYKKSGDLLLHYRLVGR